MKVTNRVAPFAAALIGAVSLGIPGAWLFGRYAHAEPNAAATAMLTAAPATTLTSMTLPDFSRLVDKYGSAVVNITVTGHTRTGLAPKNFGFSQDDPFSQFFRGFPMPEPPDAPTRGQGSGFIVRAEGIVLTNAHVVDDAQQVTVRLTDKREFTAKVLGSDKQSDVAVLKIDAKDLPIVHLGRETDLKVGQWVVAIGAPFGFDNSVTAGIVSAKRRVLPGDGYVPFIQT
ncbi:MAG TPA: trypsin-like peptidase domain-containing protein, partial [Steroidobacteraceae bacterium]|nr:trypsin-like peptidase domain-containing protein [Steroidobacteraceae bacterium]